MEFKGTKGIWFKSGLEIVSMPSQTKISNVSGSDYEEAKANAFLISKAPEMLEMLKEISNTLEIMWHNDGSNEIFDAEELDNLIKQATEL